MPLGARLARGQSQVAARRQASAAAARRAPPATRAQLARSAARKELDARQGTLAQRSMASAAGWDACAPLEGAHAAHPRSQQQQ